jgi:hypothetical protein
MKKQLYRAAAATVLGLSLTTGIVAADTGNITNTGPGSSNNVTANSTDNSHLMNHNNVSAWNDNDQGAHTGDANVSGNTTGGSATTGNATNTSSSTFTFDVSN